MKAVGKPLRRHRCRDQCRNSAQREGIAPRKPLRRHRDTSHPLGLDRQCGWMEGNCFGQLVAIPRTQFVAGSMRRYWCNRLVNDIDHQFMVGT